MAFDEFLSDFPILWTPEDLSIPVRVAAKVYVLFRKRHVIAHLSSKGKRIVRCSGIPGKEVAYKVPVCGLVERINLPTFATIDLDVMLHVSNALSFALRKYHAGTYILPVRESIRGSCAEFALKLLSVYNRLLKSGDEKVALEILVRELKQSLFGHSRLIRVQDFDAVCAWEMLRRLLWLYNERIFDPQEVDSTIRYNELSALYMVFLDVWKPTEVRLSGRIDVLLRRNGKVYVIEVKQGMSLYELAQLGLYAKLVEAKGYEVVPILAHTDGILVKLYRLKTLDFLSQPADSIAIKDLIEELEEPSLEKLIRGALN